ncbi:hypothetical protein [Marinococcus luteus]|uniref:hypothetical protein n=1 Tax=Marinococcus luteus TaxID=1122204 RepID=UPI002ACC881D|nr:hypothetical protein [Marinococcus luteus]MDZ5781976.1 hypothetical protein [Marinococcus luteus]
MMKEWQIGALSGFVATISIILVDSLTFCPYLVQLLVALVISVLGTILSNRLLNYWRKHKESSGN